MNYIKPFIFIFSAFILSGCLSSVKLKPETNYTLNAVPDVAKKRTHPITLMVLLPETDAAYNTTQMVYSQNPYQIAYYDKNRWAETPGQMLQPLIVQALQNTHYFHAVLTPPIAYGRYQYVLSTQILQLKQDYSRRPVMARLTTRAELIRIASNQVVATKEFTVSVPMQQYTPYGGVVAANKATKEFLAELTHFCIKNAR